MYFQNFLAAGESSLSNLLAAPISSMCSGFTGRETTFFMSSLLKKLLVIVGREDIVAKMIETNKKNKRFSALKMRIMGTLNNA